MKGKQVLKLFLLSFLMTRLIVADCSASESKLHIMTCASWNKEYHSMREMYEDSDYVLYGFVDEQNVVQSGELVFTHSTITVESIIKGEPENKIVITQIGGEGTSLIVEAPEESPLLATNQLYCFFLSKGELYYSINGAGQGVIAVDNLDDYITFYDESDERIDSSSLFATPETPVNGLAFSPSTTVAFFNISNSGLQTYRSNIQAGAQLWNGIGNFNLYPSSGYAQINIQVTTADISVPLSTVAITTSGRQIYMYSDRLASSGAVWKKVACHEVGHAIGLAHNTVSYSVMTSGVANQAPEPQYCDELTIRELYPY